MTHEDFDNDNHHHSCNECHATKTKKRLPSVFKVLLAVAGLFVGLIGVGLALLVVALVAGPASGIAQWVADVWQSVLDTLKPFADLYNQTIGMFSGQEAE